MKKTILLIALFIILVSVIIIEKNRKTDLYIPFQKIEGYNFYLNDSVAWNISKIEISHTGELSYQRWEIFIDSSKTEKTNKENLIRHLTCSTDFIINNFGWNSDLVTDTRSFKLYFIKWEKDEPYLLPIKDIHYITE